VCRFGDGISRSDEQPMCFRFTLRHVPSLGAETHLKDTEAMHTLSSMECSVHLKISSLVIIIFPTIFSSLLDCGRLNNQMLWVKVGHETVVSAGPLSAMLR
jgi:hypothetical protein